MHGDKSECVSLSDDGVTTFSPGVSQLSSVLAGGDFFPLAATNNILPCIIEDSIGLWIGHVLHIIIQVECLSLGVSNDGASLACISSEDLITLFRLEMLKSRATITLLTPMGIEEASLLSRHGLCPVV